jgi:hypothetical protein
MLRKREEETSSVEEVRAQSWAGRCWCWAVGRRCWAAGVVRSRKRGLVRGEGFLFYFENPLLLLFKLF